MTNKTIQKEHNPFPSARKTLALAGLCSVVDQTSGEQVSFIPTPEQKEMIEHVGKHKTIVFLKGRQIGCSSVVCFLDVVYAIMYPGAKVAVVADTEQKSHGLLDRCRGFLHDLGVSTTISNRSKIRLVSGSEIHALTANASKGQEQSKAGRSLSFQMLHLSEIAFWPDQDAFGALTASAGLSAPIIIESTSSGPGDLLWHLWNASNSFKKVFFPVEDHLAYRADSSTLNEDDIQRGKDLGFSNPEAMAWWLQILDDRFGGDVIRCLREYPQMPEQAFQSREGRWINVTPPVLDHTTVDEIKIFTEQEVGHKYIIGVDTAGGIRQDSSAIAVIDKTMNRMVASYVCSEATIDTLSSKIATLYSMYRPDYACIEVNGIGLATAQMARDKGVPVREVKTTDSSRYTGLLLTKRQVEKGNMFGPIELAEESDDLHVDKREKFAGKKDLCMAIGFCLIEMKDNPVIQKETQKTNVFDMKKHLRKRQY
tara:strand:+ start:662 stop:2107 length:1446 start_codon:yes stop_codon:yes gene_type:complete